LVEGEGGEKMEIYKMADLVDNKISEGEILVWAKKYLGQIWTACKHIYICYPTRQPKPKGNIRSH